MPDPARWCVRTKFETRADEGGEAGLIRGYAAVTNQPTLLWEGFVETISDGAFTDTIVADDVRALFNHDPMVVLGRNTAGTLRLAEDRLGLQYEIDADLRIGAVRDVYLMIGRKDITQSSFGFDILAEEWIYPETDDDPVQHLIKRVKLYDVAPVTFPAFPQTTVDVPARTRFLHAAAHQVHRDFAEVAAMEPAQLRALFRATPPPEPKVPPSTPLLTAAVAELHKRQYRR
jgi:hypothetical protein